MAHPSKPEVNVQNVASARAARKPPAPTSPSSSDVDAFLRRFQDGATAMARYGVRTMLAALRVPLPRMPAHDLRGLAEHLLTVGAGIDVDDLARPAVHALMDFWKLHPLIALDRLLRGTLPGDMAADVRSCLRAIAGHVDADKHQMWADRETLAGETGVTLARLDRILALLQRHGWLKVEARRRPGGGRTSNLITLTFRSGTWPTVQKRQHTPPPPQTHEARAARAAALTLGVVLGGGTPAGTPVAPAAPAAPPAPASPSLAPAADPSVLACHATARSCVAEGDRSCVACKSVLSRGMQEEAPKRSLTSGSTPCEAPDHTQGPHGEKVETVSEDSDAAPSSGIRERAPTSPDPSVPLSLVVALLRACGYNVETFVEHLRRACEGSGHDAASGQGQPRPPQRERRLAGP